MIIFTFLLLFNFSQNLHAQSIGRLETVLAELGCNGLRSGLNFDWAQAKLSSFLTKDCEHIDVAKVPMIEFIDKCKDFTIEEIHSPGAWPPGSSPGCLGMNRMVRWAALDAILSCSMTNKVFSDLQKVKGKSLEGISNPLQKISFIRIPMDKNFMKFEASCPPDCGAVLRFKRGENQLFYLSIDRGMFGGTNSGPDYTVCCKQNEVKLIQGSDQCQNRELNKGKSENQTKPAVEGTRSVR